MHRDLNEVRDCAIWISGGKGILGVWETASTKTLRRKHNMVYSGNKEVIAIGVEKARGSGRSCNQRDEHVRPHHIRPCRPL